MTSQIQLARWAKDGDLAMDEPTKKLSMRTSLLQFTKVLATVFDELLVHRTEKAVSFGGCLRKDGDDDESTE